MQIGSRIINGQNAPKPIPWQVAMYKRTPSQYFKCGGSIINEDTILTAAHCFEEDVEENGTVFKRLNTSPKDYFINVGLLQHSAPPVKKYEVKNITVHEDYDVIGRQFHHDIAIVKTMKKMKFSNNVKPICLPKTFTSEYQTCFISGWGSTQASKYIILKLVFLMLKSH